MRQEDNNNEQTECVKKYCEIPSVNFVQTEYTTNDISSTIQKSHNMFLYFSLSLSLSFIWSSVFRLFFLFIPFKWIILLGQYKIQRIYERARVCSVRETLAESRLIQFVAKVKSQSQHNCCTLGQAHKQYQRHEKERYISSFYYICRIARHIAHKHIHVQINSCILANCLPLVTVIRRNASFLSTCFACFIIVFLFAMAMPFLVCNFHSSISFGLLLFRVCLLLFCF